MEDEERKAVKERVKEVKESALKSLAKGEKIGKRKSNGTGDNGYVYALNELVIPSIQKFGPDMFVLTIGLDSSAFDPNGRQCLTMEGYRKIGKIVHDLAKQHSDGRLVIVQEGG
ncbi:hypothetical protein HN51_047029 [Arachis hypogaea]|nr:histone deacetylase 8-like [Arachis hypogaea]